MKELESSQSISPFTQYSICHQVYVFKSVVMLLSYSRKIKTLSQVALLPLLPIQSSTLMPQYQVTPFKTLQWFPLNLHVNCPSS